MATDKITTTYNELKELGACKDGLETLWKWLTARRGLDPRRITWRMEYDALLTAPLTPADILESNGAKHLWWCIRNVPGWWQSFELYESGNYMDWAKSVSQEPQTGAFQYAGFWGPYCRLLAESSPKKVLAKDLKEGDEIEFLGRRRVVTRVFPDGQIGLSRTNQYQERFDPETLDAIGFTLLSEQEPKKVLAKDLKIGYLRTVRDGQVTVDDLPFPYGTSVEVHVTKCRPAPRRLKAEQILVPENVGTKWRNLDGRVARVRKRPEPRTVGTVEFYYDELGRQAHLTSEGVTCYWEEVLE